MLGKNIKRLCAEKKISHTQFAKDLGVSRTALVGYLEERNFMTTDKAELAAKLLGVPIAQLFGEDIADMHTLVDKIGKQQEKIDSIEKMLEEFAINLQYSSKK
jgi:transcriptional regulator with XRE-family HTH domain